MSSFLHRLGARALAARSGIEPRLPSRFEAGPGSVGDSDTELPTDSTTPAAPPSKAPDFPPASVVNADSCRPGEIAPVPDRTRVEPPPHRSDRTVDTDEPVVRRQASPEQADETSGPSDRREPAGPVEVRITELGFKPGTEGDAAPVRATPPGASESRTTVREPVSPDPAHAARAEDASRDGRKAGRSADEVPWTVARPAFEDGTRNGPSGRDAERERAGSSSGAGPRSAPQLHVHIGRIVVQAQGPRTAATERAARGAGGGVGGGVAAFEQFLARRTRGGS